MLTNQSDMDRLERMEAKQDSMRELQQAILTKVESLAGNGQPGRVGLLETRMLRVEESVTFVRGNLLAYGSIGVAVLAGLEVALKFIH